MQKKTYWALVPVKSNSQRVPCKNVKILNKHPLFAWSINIGLLSGIYDKIIVVTDSGVIADNAMLYGADVFRRSQKTCRDDSPDIEWVYELFTNLKNKFKLPDAFSILRPTSPFRSIDMLTRAHSLFANNKCHSLRAVEPLNVNLYKVWEINKDDKFMQPFYSEYTIINDFLVPFHSYPTQFAPKSNLFKQNASLEISYTSNVLNDKSITGKDIIPFYTEGYEGFDINVPLDWLVAEQLIEIGAVIMHNISIKKGGCLLNTF